MIAFSGSLRTTSAVTESRLGMQTVVERDGTEFELPDEHTVAWYTALTAPRRTSHSIRRRPDLFSVSARSRSAVTALSFTSAS
jgi:hypothetical protein